MADFLDRSGVSEHLSQKGLKVSKKTLANWASEGIGPPYHRFGGRCVYPIKELDAWLSAELGEPTNASWVEE